MVRRISIALVVLCLLVLSVPAHAALTSFITMTNGYFYDSAVGKAWTPKGIAYQTWNRPLGVWQTPDQIVYDLDEMVKMGVDSIRIDMVWQHIEETADDQWNWSNYDFLFQECDKRNIRVFALIGYQWPPSWFPDAWYTMHPPGYDDVGIYHTNRWQSDIINYEHPSARAQYSNFIYQVTRRYKDTKAVAGWIVGNEYGYLGLWSLKYDGYDTNCEAAFRTWCTAKYTTVTNLNAYWKTAYTNFNQIVLVDEYAWKGSAGAEWADMVQWHEDSIASFTALGAKAARNGDTNHLRSYATVGMQWGEEDWRYHAEDRGKIAQACASNTAPLAFFSVNNYPWALDGHETRNGQWGVSFTKKVANMPVLYTETGFTSSETLFPGMSEGRQGGLIRNAMWEGMEAGAIGMHVFTWQDRPWISEREKGFGILYNNRGIKPAFWTCSDAYRLMGQAKLNELLAGSADPKPDIAFLWTAASDSQYVRYENEMQHEAGALERLGYEPNFINLAELAAGAYTNYKVIILPRNMRVDTVVPGKTNSVLNFLLKNVVASGIHVIAVADLPGEQDPWGWPRAAFTTEVSQLFGINASDVGAFQPKGAMSDTVMWDYFHPIDVMYNTNAPAGMGGYTYSPGVWKYNDRIRLTDGTLWASMNTRKNRGFESSSAAVPEWGSWGTYEVRDWFPYEGTNMLRLWGSSGAWQNNNDVIPGERYSARAYLRNNSDDPLRGGAYGQVSLEWYTTNNTLISTLLSAKLSGPTPSNTWVEYKAEGVAPTNASYCRTILRTDADAAPQLLLNAGLSGSGDSPTNWAQWNTANHDADASTYRSAPNSWNFWYDGGIYQDVYTSTNFIGGDTIAFGGYLYTPSGDALRNGTKYGVIQVEFWNGGGLISTFSASPTINSNSTKDTWISSSGTATVPTNATYARVVVRCNDYSSGDGTFRADDITFTKQGASGSCYFDGDTWVPAVVAKNHGTAKSVIVLHSLDQYTDPDGDGKPDVEPWKWRSDVLSSIIKDYFGVQPALSITGTNYYMALTEYRTCTNNATLWQIKSHAYNWETSPTGGVGQTFTIVSSLFTGKTIRAFEQGRVLATNSGNTVSLTLAPDAQEILYVFSPGTNRKEIVQIAAAPASVHPLGDKAYSVVVKYDCQGTTGLVAKAAFKEVGDNGDGVTNEVYAVLTNAASGAATVEFLLWIPPYRQNDADYKSTSDGGKYEFAAWLESAGSVHVADAVPLAAALDWGIRPTSATPTNMTKGSSYQLPIEWENLVESLPWQLTPVARNSSYPGRVAVYRSAKTEAQFPGHWAKANAVCDWLESMGYSAGNPLDILFDNVVVSNLLTDNFNTGSTANWTRVAGSANWTVEKCPADWGSGLPYDKYTTFALNATNRQLSFKVVADATKTVDKVHLYLSRAAGTCPTYSLGLYGDGAGLPTGAPLSAVNFSVVTSAYHWERIELPDYTWTAGRTYHFVLKYASGFISATNAATIEYCGPDTTGRKVLTSTNTGAAWTETTYEPTFRVLYTDTNSFAQPYVTAAGYTFLGVTNYGQRFTPPYPMSVTNLTLRLYRQSTATGDVLVNIRKWSDKSLVVSSRLARTAVATTSSWVRFGFAAPVNLAANTQYYYELQNLGPTGFYYVARGNTLSGYGAFSWGLTTNCTLFSTNSGTLWATQGDYDLGFLLGATLGDGQSLRASRIGNSDNLMVAGGMWTNYSVAVDVKYKKQDYYFSDAELYVRYQNRSNYYRVSLQNYYGFWRMKYAVVVGGAIQQQGWLYEFSKTNRPVENTWYNLRVEVAGSTNKVFLNGQQVGTFWATNFATGKIGIGSRAVQLGIWEPQKGYFFIDDDEFNMTGGMLNMDWGYLDAFYTTLILPGVYVMNDAEAANVGSYVTNGLFGVLSTDGSVAMKDELGNVDMGRVENVFGVGTTMNSLSNITKLSIGSESHYVTLDYAAGSQLNATGAAKAWTTLTTGKSLGAVQNGSSAPALIVNTITTDPEAPAKVMVFNFGVDGQGQLTNSISKIATRTFEWLRGDAYLCKIELKYAGDASTQADDFTVWSSNVWILTGSGSNIVNFTLPSDGIMTGTNLVWSYTVYPWDSTNYWTQNQGWFPSEGQPVVIPGKGLQIVGMTANAFAGRDWDMWTAYNTLTTTVTLTYGIKDKGTLQNEDNFNDGDYAGWYIVAYSNVAWSVASSSLQAQVTAAPYGYAYIYRNGGLNVTGKNITVEYDTRFTGGAYDGGVIYCGRVLYVNPNTCGWADNAPNYYVTNRPATGVWNHVVVHIRDDVPYLRSDLYVGGHVVFLNEPIEVTNWTTNTVGFLSPYSNVNALVQWDNVRVADEQYSVSFTNVSGEKVSTNALQALWPSIPDYDPDMLEHDGTAGGASYEWYLYARGEGLHCVKDGNVYFSPRLMVESASFPTNFAIGTNIVVPVQWEYLSASQLPARIRVRLWDAFSGLIYVEKTATVAVVGGSTNVAVTVPTMPSGSNYVWTAFLYPTNAIDPWNERIGSDDTFRFDEYGIGLQPETPVTVTGITYSNNILVLYSDAGTMVGSTVLTWQGSSATFNGDYNDGTAPEGTKTFFTTGTSWQGWGVFKVGGGMNMSTYSNGYLKFWVKSSTQLKVDLEGPQGTKGTKYIASTTNLWKEMSLAITNFTGAVLTNLYGLFEITGESAASFYVDNVRWEVTPPTNQAPQVNAGNDQNITLPSYSTLNATVTDDGLPAGTLTLTWSKISGPGTVAFTNTATANTRAHFSTNGTYVLRLTATDSALYSYDEIQVSVSAAAGTNTAPVVNAGSDFAINLPASAMLAGWASDDGLPSGYLSYEWTKVSGPGSVTFTNTATPNTRASFSTNGTYVLRLTANDMALSGNDDVQVTVNQATTNQSADVSAASLSVSRPADPGMRTFTACSFDIVNSGPVGLTSEWVMAYYYLSSNAVFGDADDRKIGDTGFTLSIEAGETYPIGLTSVGLSNMVDEWTWNLVTSGTYYVYTKLFLPDGSPTDPNTNNNYTASSSFAFTPTPADVWLTNLVVQRSADTSRRTFTNCQFSIVNYGPTTVTNESIFIDFFLSSDTTFGNGDDAKIGDVGLTLSISPGYGWNITLSGTGLDNMSRFWTEFMMPNSNYYVYAQQRIYDGSPYDPNPSNDFTRTVSTFPYVAETRLTVNGAYSNGNISVSLDSDWFEFTTTSNGTVTIDTQAGTLTDNYMYLFGPNDRTTLIEEDDDDGTGNMAQIVRSLNAGTYHVKIEGYSILYTGTYTIRVTQ